MKPTIAIVPHLPLASGDLKLVRKALQTQVTRDLVPAWGIDANVIIDDEYLTYRRRPPGVWPIFIVTKEASDAHAVSASGVPYALVQYASTWTSDVSHEMIEMLVNPFIGTVHARTIVAPSPEAEQGLVPLLVEICDPVNPANYEIDGVSVSDFVWPRYYDRPTGERPYDQLDRLEAPREVLRGGYLEWTVGEPPVKWHRWYDPERHRLVNDIERGPIVIAPKHHRHVAADDSVCD